MQCAAAVGSPAGYRPAVCLDHDHSGEHGHETSHPHRHHQASSSRPNQGSPHGVGRCSRSHRLLSSKDHPCHAISQPAGDGHSAAAAEEPRCIALGAQGGDAGTLRERCAIGGGMLRKDVCEVWRHTYDNLGSFVQPPPARLGPCPQRHTPAATHLARPRRCPPIPPTDRSCRRSCWRHRTAGRGHSQGGCAWRCRVH